MKRINIEFICKNKSLFKHKKAVFIVGAGISVSSGIPDFRSTSGIFSRLKKEIKIDGMTFFSYHFGLKKETRMTYLKYISELKKLCDSVSPSIVHEFLTNYPKSRVYTQNIDCLESKAGMVFKKDFTTRGVYLHGNLSQLVCQYCGFKTKFGDEDIAKFKNNQEVECVNCADKRKTSLLNNRRTKPLGIMHPGIIHYHQAHPDAAFIGKIVEKDLNCDLLIVIGTSLKVQGVKNIVKRFASSNNVKGKRILVNLTNPTKEWEDVFDYFFEGDCNQFVQILNSKSIKEKCAVDNEITEKTSSYLEVDLNNANKLDEIEKISTTICCEAINNEILTENKIMNYEEKCIEISEKSLNDKNSVVASMKRISLSKIDNSIIISEDDAKTMSYLNNERYDEKLLKKNEITNPHIYTKLQKLSDIFMKEENILMPILDEVLATSKNANVEENIDKN